MTLRKIKLIFSVNGITIKVKEIIDEITRCGSQDDR